MVICNLSPDQLNLDVNEEHLATDWLISETLDFNNPVLESRDDRTNLTNIIFQNDLDSGKKWYSKARIRTNKGWGVWGNVAIFNISESIDAVDMTDMPSKISVPQITTSSNQSNHKQTMFNVMVTGFSVIGNSTHIATSWIIEDINGNTIWHSLNDEVNKLYIEVNNLLLDPNTVYRIKAIFHNSTSDTSPVGCLTIRTQSESEITLLTYLDFLDPTKDQIVEIAPIEKKKLTFSIYGYTDNNIGLIWTKESSGLSVTIPANTLIKNKCYILNIETDATANSSRNVVFTTMKE